MSMANDAFKKINIEMVRQSSSLIVSMFISLLQRAAKGR